jgi:hypothetical protein
VSAIAEHWEPCERRRSRTVLREPWSETLHGYSPHPVDLPIEQPTVFDFVLNLISAQTRGISFPNDVLIQATRLIS